MNEQDKDFRMLSESFKKTAQPESVIPQFLWMELRIKELMRAAKEYMVYDPVNINRISAWIDEAVFIAELYQEIYDKADKDAPASDIIEVIMTSPGDRKRVQEKLKRARH